jgi:hypothetical protein
MPATSGSDAVSIAKKWVGTPYCWGGGHGGPVKIGTCVDCSGLVDQVYGTSGNTFTQVKLGTAIDSIKNASPGDLVFFGPLAPGEPHHVGIYIGSGSMIDAPHTGTKVRTDSVNGFGPINAIRRLLPTTSKSNGSGSNSTSGAIYDYAQLEGVWIQAGGNAQYAPMAAAIAMAESGGNSQASNTNNNSSVDRGLWQINSSNGSSSSFDVMTNARGAVSISSNGTNWRPWCTAYSDGACGTNGGTYQGAGSPYLRFLQFGIAPDNSVPINATNAQANQPATLTSSTGITDPISEGIKLVIISILNPVIQAVAGILGITAGGILMIFGMYMMITQSQTGRQVQKAGGTAVKGAAKIVAPESRLAGTSLRTYEKTLPSGQTQVTYVAGKSGWRRYQQKTTTKRYGVTGTTRDDLRDQANSYGGPP